MSKTSNPRGRAFRFVASHPLRFVFVVGRAFRSNQGLLLAGAIAYYALLAIVPLLILAAIALSHFVGEQLLLDTLAHLLEWLIPGLQQSWPSLQISLRIAP